MEFIIGLGLGVLGILITIGIFFYQERSPVIDVSAHPVFDGVPNIIECKVTNSGKKQVENVYVGFNRALPIDTVVRAAPEIGAELIESESLPDPHLMPNEALLLKAFAIRIPRISAGDTITFQVVTTNPDNERAAKQVLKIRPENFKVITDFIKEVGNKYPETTSRLDIETLKSARIKKENFFAPGQFSYEKGRFPISYVTEKEQVISAINQDIYSRHKKEFIQVFKNRPEFKAPVLRIKTTNGQSTVGIFPPYIKTSVTFRASRKELEEKQEIMMNPPVPDSYD